MFDVERFFVDFHVSFISEGTKHCQAGWIQLECPFCTGNKGHHLGYDLRNNYFNCWRCGFKPTIQIVQHFTRTGWEKAKELAKEYATVGHNLSHLIPDKKRHKAEYVTMPTGTGPLEPRHIKYLRKRKYNPKEVEETWGLLGTGPVGAYKHRIIAPIYFQKRLVSYQGRDYTEKSKLKYKACKQEEEAIDHKLVLYGLDKAEGDRCVLVEGITDVWRLGPGAVATFGIKTKNTQILLLAEKFRKVFVMFDDDPEAVKRAQEIAYNLSMCGLESEICIIEGDPGQLNQDTADAYMSELLD